MLDDQDYLKKNDEKQDEQLKMLNNTLLQISGDIREIMTKMNHFEERFETYAEEIKEIRETSRLNESKTSAVITEQEVIKSRGKDIENEVARIREKLNSENYRIELKIDSEVDELINKFKETEEKTDKDRKFLVTTIISVVVGFATIAITLISIFL